MPADTEHTPLLSHPNDHGPVNDVERAGIDATEAQAIKNHEAIYDRFNPREKTFILSITAWCGVLPCMFILICLAKTHC